MRTYCLNVKEDKKDIYSGHIKLGGFNPKGDKISISNYYLELNGEPFFGISGEFHYSRYDKNYWEEEIVKMKLCGINIISTYIFWNHHEEVQGVFEWTGNKSLRKFIELCHKNDVYVIVRIGPFDHGEVRNGGMPDWMFGRPFEVRSNDKEYLAFVDRLYKEIGKQIEGLMYKDGGPIIGTQIENEYMHSASPWELTTGINNEWLPGGNDGNSHMKNLKMMALNAGIDTPLYTCTAWGGAATPLDEMIPLWGGYAFWPWIFYGDVEEHPATPEYVFRDYHNNKMPKCYNYEPTYEPESFPYSCCEMGGGMTVFYKYRFILPAESVTAMSLIKVAGGCNFVGYYMFHGGSNPKGKVNQFLNEHATPKISYDFQAAIGEFGQIRKSYKELKVLHYFLSDFEKELSPMKSIIPEEAGSIDPHDVDTLRYAVRARDGKGFVFINNYQDHVETKQQRDFNIKLEFEQGEINIPEKGGLSLEKDSCCILPFNFNVGATVIKYATAQPITVMEHSGEKYYFFFTPEGMNGEYCFDKKGICDIEASNANIEETKESYFVRINDDCTSIIKLVTENNQNITVCTLTKVQSMNFWKVKLDGEERAIISDGTLALIDGALKIEATDIESVNLDVFPSLSSEMLVNGASVIKKGFKGIFYSYEFSIERKNIEIKLNKIKNSKATINISKEQFTNIKDIMLRVDYVGDIGYAFIDGELINDNFCNGATWEIALKRFEDMLVEKGMYIYIAPIKEGNKVSSDSTMAGRTEVTEKEIAEINSIKAVPIYEITINF
jgi:hypothetical protein